ncbi:hypothetical protein LTR95_012101 [Oleoguttula sp. CCFEE 5521]
MPAPRARPVRPAMYNTPAIRNGGFGALQVEAYTNRPLSIARRHLAASQLRIRDIEPDELSSSEWVRFLAMEEFERNRWMSQFIRRRRNSDESQSSVDAEVAHDKEQEAAEEAAEERRRQFVGEGSSAAAPQMSSAASPGTPAVSQWVRDFDGTSASNAAQRPMHLRRAVTDMVVEAPPSYDTVLLAPGRARTPPPAYEPRSDDEEGMSPRYVRNMGEAP